MLELFEELRFGTEKRGLKYRLLELVFRRSIGKFSVGEVALVPVDQHAAQYISLLSQKSAIEAIQDAHQTYASHNILCSIASSKS